MVRVFASIPKVKDQTSLMVLCVINNGMLIDYSSIEFLK
jgi:hypothetical protein